MPTDPREYAQRAAREICDLFPYEAPRPQSEFMAAIILRHMGAALREQRGGTESQIPSWPQPVLTEADVRRVVREEIAKAKAEKEKP